MLAPLAGLLLLVAAPRAQGWPLMTAEIAKVRSCISAGGARVSYDASASALGSEGDLAVQFPASGSGSGVALLFTSSAASAKALETKVASAESANNDSLGSPSVIGNVVLTWLKLPPPNATEKALVSLCVKQAQPATAASTPAAAKPSSASSSSGSAATVTDLEGHRYTVTALAFYDPATPATDLDGAAAGKRLLAVKFRIADTGAAAISDDANGDVTVVGANGQVYQPSFDDVAGCTNFNSGDFSLAPGGAVVGCVAFEIPTTVKATRVVFDASSGFGGTRTATWPLND